MARLLRPIDLLPRDAMVLILLLEAPATGVTAREVALACVEKGLQVTEVEATHVIGRLRDRGAIMCVGKRPAEGRPYQTRGWGSGPQLWALTAPGQEDAQDRRQRLLTFLTTPAQALGQSQKLDQRYGANLNPADLMELIDAGSSEGRGGYQGGRRGHAFADRSNPMTPLPRPPRGG